MNPSCSQLVFSVATHVTPSGEHFMMGSCSVEEDWPPATNASSSVEEIVGTFVKHDVFRIVLSFLIKL